MHLAFVGSVTAADLLGDLQGEGGGPSPSAAPCRWQAVAMSGPRVVLASGHMVDLPDRATPRFPVDQVSRVTAEVQDALGAWDVGPGSTVVCGGARGADLIVAEQALARG